MIVVKILLFLLLFILVLVALILFFPVTYKVAGKSNGTLDLRADVRWLLAVVFLRASFDTEEKKPKVVLRLFGVPVTLYPREPKKAKPEKKQQKTDELPDTSVSEQISTEASEAVTQQRIEAGEEAGPPGRLERAKAFFQRIADALRSIPKRFVSFREKLRRGKEKAAQIKKELLDPHNKEAVQHLFSEGKFLLSHYRPRRIRAKLKFSTGDPATTGELTGALALLPPVYEKGNRITPDFTAEQAYLDGTFSVSGHIILIFAVVSVVRLLADRNFRRLLKHIKAMR